MSSEIMNYFRTGDTNVMRETIEVAGKKYVSSEVRFYTVCDLVDMTGWSEKIILRLFNDPSFPSADFGKTKVVEAHALIEYFSKKRTKKDEYYWKKGELRDELRKRVR